MKNMAPQLITNRLLLNEITEHDTELIVAWRSNPEVYKYFLSPHPLEVEEHLNWFHGRYILDENCFHWMAMARKHGEHVGVFGIKRQEIRLASVEVSYLLAPEHQGKGYANEALGKIIEFAKKVWGASEAVAKVHVKNKESVKFATSLGFEYLSKDGNFDLYIKKL